MLSRSSSLYFSLLLSALLTTSPAHSLPPSAFFDTKQMAMLDQTAHAWVSHHEFTDAQLQKMANVLFLSYACAVHDVQISIHNHNAWTCMWFMSQNLNRHSALKWLQHVQEQLEQAEKVLERRTKRRRQWKVSLTFLKKKTKKRSQNKLDTAFCILQDTIKQELRDYLHCTDNDTRQLIAQAFHGMQELRGIIEQIAGVYHNLGKGELPIKVDEPDTLVAQLHIAAKLGDALDAQSWKHHQLLLPFTKQIVDLGKMTATLLVLYYAKVHQEMKKRNLTERYFMVMFDTKNLVPDYRRSEELPHPSTLRIF